MDNKSPDFDKWGVIGVLWVIMAALSFFGLTIMGSQAEGQLTWYFVLPLIIAFVGTILVWGLDLISTRMTAQQKTEIDPEKAKRQGMDKLALLMELLDEDERARFKARLMDEVLAEAGSGSDGELPYDAASLGALLAENESAQALRE